MKYPGRVIKEGEANATVVKALKSALNDALTLRGSAAIQLDPDNPIFGPRMKQAVQLFQTRHLDAEGQSLKADGEIGAITWAALFGQERVPYAEVATDSFLARVLQIASMEEKKGVREVPKNSNRGPEVDAYLKCVGVSTGHGVHHGLWGRLLSTNAQASECEQGLHRLLRSVSTSMRRVFCYADRCLTVAQFISQPHTLPL